MTQMGNSAARRDIAYHFHPYTNLKAHEATGPLIITAGSGVRVIDDEGKSYIEGLSGLWCAALGFNQERLVEAATRQMRKLPFYHSFSQKVPDVVIELAERLIKIAPAPMAKVFFTNSGSEANDTVVKMVWYLNNALGRPKKKKIIGRIKGYHGVTVAAASLCGLPLMHADFDLPIANILHTDCPHFYRFGQEGESEADFASRMAESLEGLILAEGPETVAAFIAEPVMGAGGVIVPPATYFEKIQAVLRKYDVLMVADEVICGFGRTGNMFGSQTYKIEPDIMTLAKALSAAYLPIAAVLVSDKVFAPIRDNSAKLGTFSHGFTYGGHPVSAAVALETLKIYEEHDILGHARNVGPRMQKGLRAFADHPLVGEVRGVGMIAGIELVADKKTRAPFPAPPTVGPYLVGRAQAHGLILRAMGDSIAFCPPLVISEAEIDEMIGCFARALEDTQAWLAAEERTSTAV